MNLLTGILSALKVIEGSVKFVELVWKGAGCFRAILGDRVNPLALQDEDFMFLHTRFIAASGHTYYPTTNEEVQNCKSLCNYGVLRHVDCGYKFTWSYRYQVKKI